MANAFATIKKPGDLKAGDVTPWYTVLEDAEPGTDNNGICVVVRIRWEDGALDYRVWDDLTAEIEVLHTLTPMELHRMRGEG